jgi:hypothetical protein
MSAARVILSIGNKFHMRILNVICPLLMAASVAIAEDISKNPSVTLAGEKLFLANVEGGGSHALLNEYIRKSESFDNWTVLFAVRRVQTTTGVNDVVRRWKTYLAQVNSPGLMREEEEGSSANDRRFRLAIRSPGDAYLEIDEFRFIPASDGKGVIYYQAAVRVSTNSQSELNQGLVKELAFAEALKSISVAPLEKLPGPTADAALEKVSIKPLNP